MRLRLIPMLLCGCATFLVATVAGVSPALAVARPSAITGPAGNVHFTTASVFGDVNPNGAYTRWYFQYGTALSYGLDTPTSGAGSGTANVAVSAELAGLRPGARYHFRVVTSSAAGSVAGADGSFTTPAAAPGVAVGEATAVQDSSALLHATVDPHGLETIAYFEFGTSVNYERRTRALSVGDGSAAVAFAHSVTRLLANTTYHFRMVTTNAIGTTAGADEIVTTTGPATGAAGAPSAIGPNAVTLNGSVNPDGHPTSWYFQYGTSTAYGAHTAVQPAGAGQVAVSVSAPIAGLAPGTSYHFRLVMHSADGTVVGPDVAVSTLGPTLVLPSRYVVFGRTVLLSGTIPTAAANNTVTVFAQRLSDASYVMIGTVLTDSTGAWSYTTRPRIETNYKALWDGATSPPATLSVEPSVTLRGISNTRFTTHVLAARSEVGRLVRLQRLTNSGWRTIALARLDRTSAAEFQPRLAAGSSRLRVMMSGFQAGAGYATGFSRTQIFAVR